MVKFNKKKDQPIPEKQNFAAFNKVKQFAAAIEIYWFFLLSKIIYKI
jgi:hypothetical protein